MLHNLPAEFFQARTFRAGYIVRPDHQLSLRLQTDEGQFHIFEGLID